MMKKTTAGRPGFSPSSISSMNSSGYYAGGMGSSDHSIAGSIKSAMTPFPMDPVLEDDSFPWDSSVLCPPSPPKARRVQTQQFGKRGSTSRFFGLFQRSASSKHLDHGARYGPTMNPAPGTMTTPRPSLSRDLSRDATKVFRTKYRTAQYDPFVGSMIAVPDDASSSQGSSASSRRHHKSNSRSCSKTIVKFPFSSSRHDVPNQTDLTHMASYRMTEPSIHVAALPYASSDPDGAASTTTTNTTPSSRAHTQLLSQTQQEFSTMCNTTPVPTPIMVQRRTSSAFTDRSESGRSQSPRSVFEKHDQASSSSEYEASSAVPATSIAAAKVSALECTTNLVPDGKLSPPHVLEIAPGLRVELRGSQETLQYVMAGRIHTTLCSCGSMIHAVPDAAMVLCPVCKVIEPISVKHHVSSPPPYGVALGFVEDWEELRAALLLQTTATAAGAAAAQSD